MLDMVKIYNNVILWLTGGIIYFYMEIAFRGYSHFSMLICGGVCFITVGCMGRKILANSKNMLVALPKIMVSGMLIITFYEFVTGVLVNKVLGWNVWDYSEQKYNVMGQICLIYSLLWSVLSLLCVYLDIIIRKYIFDELPVKANQT